MKKRFSSFVLLLLVGATILASGCSKLTREAKYTGGAILAGITAGAAYMGNAFGIKKRKRKKQVVEEESATTNKEGITK